MPRAILFDLDGTVTDSGEGIMNCAAFALEKLGLTVPQREKLRVFVGPPLQKTFPEFGVDPKQVDEAIAIFRSRYVPIGKFENKPYPGVQELLGRLQKDGNRLFIATSKPETTALEVLEHFHLTSYFEMIAGATFDGTRDSKEDVIQYLLGQTSALEDAVMVGDTAYDVIGASAHGIPCIGVSWGYGEIQDMESAGAMSIAHTMDELYDLLTK